MADMSNQATTTATAKTLTAGQLPRIGQRVTLYGVGGAASLTPLPEGGRVATYEGCVRGTPVFTGRTSDRVFVPKSDTVTWVAR